MDSFWIPVVFSIVAVIFVAWSSSRPEQTIKFALVVGVTNAVMYWFGIGIFCMITSPMMAVVAIMLVHCTNEKYSKRKMYRAACVDVT